MKPLKALILMMMVTACAANGPYGSDNPNAATNAAATGAVGAGVLGVAALALFLGAFDKGVNSIGQ